MAVVVPAGETSAETVGPRHLIIMVPTQQVDLLVAVADGVLDAVNQKEDPGTDVRDDRRVEPRDDSRRRALACLER